ncbi:hypothetical protein [Natronosalvus amylolyticus]|uniref:hypothetical protein n=1 Tax=Natronosalvus amylolyticus TaxID=2961994 RepID=UPI0020C955DD|nr:hypothetical protein [Natronosalvus amylolyticus]
MNRETGHGDHDDQCTDSKTQHFDIEVYQLLRGDRRENDRAARADDIRFEIRHRDRTCIDTADFEALYECVGTETVTLEGDNDRTEDDIIARVLSRVWHGWNAGSGRESRAFYAAETRSLEVADVVSVDSEHYLVLPIGWEAFELEVNTDA